MTDPRPGLPPGPRVSTRVAIDLTGIDPRDLENLIRSGAVRTERIGGKLFIDLEDTERAAEERAGGGRP